MKVCFETFGCRLNKAEALEMEADYLAKGWERTERHDDADLIVVRGCSVTARAERDCRRLVAHLRRKYPRTPVRVCGCLSDKPSGGDGNRTRGRIGDAPLPANTDRRGRAASPMPPPDAPVPTRTAKAYLKVQDGCSGACTFCIVPRFRGPSVSRPFDAALDRAKRFVEAGYREIDVTGCNLALYASGGRRLPDLVDALADVSPDCRIRLSSVEPGACARETVSAMAAHANVCRFLHLPVQSGSPRILKEMRRPYSLRDVESVVTAAEKFLPGLGLGCDVMTGFPGESEADFIATEGLLRRLPFNLAHVFPYSSRPGTLAAAFPNAVPRDVRTSRARRLAAFMAERRLAFARRFLGRTVEVLVERAPKAEGWTGEYLRCRTVSPVPRKALVTLRVTRVHGDGSLDGKLV